MTRRAPGPRHRDLLRRDRRRHRPRPHAARRRGREQRRGARPLRRRRARGRQPGPPRGDGADHRAGLRRPPASGSHDVDAIAVTSGPGLAGALLVGVAAAKALALGLGKPIYGVNHLAAHVAVDQLEHGPLPEPCLAMLVSGGHSSAAAGRRRDRHDGGVEPLGATIDDAAGEAFDKVARLLGLPFPGGPHIDRAARDGPRSRSTSRAGSPRGRDLERHRFDFSFSGLKTAVARWVEARERAGEPVAGRRRRGVASRRRSATC